MPNKAAIDTDEDKAFDPKTDSTIDAGIDPKEAQVPDVTGRITETARLCVMVPMGNPDDEACIWGLMACYWGLPSTAKTESVGALEAFCGLPVAAIHTIHHQPEDLAGVVVHIGGGHVVHACMLDAVNELNAAGAGILFFDELADTTQPLQAALLSVIDKRRAGSTKISPQIRMLGAANPGMYSTSGMGLRLTTSSRMVHMQVKCPHVDRFIENLFDEEKPRPRGSVLNLEQKVRNEWWAAYSHTRGLVAGYLKSMPYALHRMPMPEHPQASYCWPSPRSWKAVARVMATATIIGTPDDVRDLVIEGLVGIPIAGEFYNWRQGAGMPTPEEVLATNWRPDLRRLDVAHAVAQSVSRYVTGIKDKKAALGPAAQAWRLLDVYRNAGMGDMIVPAARHLSKEGFSSEASEEIAVANSPVLRWLASTGILKNVTDWG